MGIPEEKERKKEQLDNGKLLVKRKENSRKEAYMNSTNNTSIVHGSHQQ